MQKTPGPVSLSATCDALEKALSGPIPLAALLNARPHLVDLVRGIRDLAGRVDALQVST